MSAGSAKSRPADAASTVTLDEHADRFWRFGYGPKQFTAFLALAPPVFVAVRTFIGLAAGFQLFEVHASPFKERFVLVGEEPGP